MVTKNGSIAEEITLTAPIAMNRQRIARAALELVEREGIEALTMKRVAEAVDRKPASLYNHIASRQDLVEAMRGIIAEEIQVDYFKTTGWRDALLRWANDYMRAFAAHPKIIAVMATTAITDPGTLATYELVVSGLVRGGWKRGQAVAVMRAVEAYVLGSALDIVAPETLLNRDMLPAGLVELRENLDPENSASWSAQAGFEIGIHALLEGFEAALARQK